MNAKNHNLPKSSKQKEENEIEDNGLMELSASEKTPLRLYLNDIGKYPLLTPEEEVTLAKKIKRGDKKAKEKMIRSNLRLVVKIAQDYNHFGLPYLDLISEGNIGLIKAIERFDPSKGGKLSTYAAWWIKQSIKRALANQSKTIRLPVHLVEKVSRIKKAEDKLRELHKREPSNEEIAQAVNLPINKVAHFKSVAIRPSSLDITVGKDDSTKLGDLIGDRNASTPSDDYFNKSQIDDIHDALKEIEERESQIIIMRFGLDNQRPKTLEDVGVALGLTRERVRQLQYIALRQLREILADKERQRTKEEAKEETIEKKRAEVMNEYILSKKKSSKKK